MNTEKRIRKPPEKFEDIERKQPRKERQLEKKRKVSGCDYELISVPQKFEDSGTLFLAHGNIPWSIKENEFECNMSLLNEFHLYRGVHVADYEGQKIVVVKTERRTDRRYIRWKTVVKKASQGGSRSKHFATAVQGYCERVEQTANDYIHKVASLSVQKGGKAKIAELKEEVDNKKRELVTKFPYFQCRSSFRGFQTELDEILVNERFLQIIGFSIETFISTVLSEGLPALLGMRLGSESDMTTTQCRYGHQEGKYKSEAPTIYFCLHSRSNFVQDAKITTYLLMNHDDTEYKCDLIYVLTDHNHQFSLPPIYKGPALTSDYISFMMEREKQMEEFLKYFKSDLGFIKFSNQHKICKIKEIQPIKQEKIEEEEEEEKESTTASPPTI